MGTITTAILVRVLGKAALKAYQKDKRNRYHLNAPWTLPRIDETIPDYEDDLFRIRDSVITVKPYAGNICDGCSLAPDKIGSKIKPVVGALFHDPWYIRGELIAEEWGWDVKRVRALGDRVFYGILIQYAGPVAKPYYRFVRGLGGLYHSIKAALALAVLVAVVGGGCCTPDDPFDGRPIDKPDYQKTAQNINAQTETQI
jgi:hypothetical protein